MLLESSSESFLTVWWLLAFTKQSLVSYSNGWKAKRTWNWQRILETSGTYSYKTSKQCFQHWLYSKSTFFHHLNSKCLKLVILHEKKNLRMENNNASSFKKKKNYVVVASNFVVVRSLLVHKYVFKYRRTFCIWTKYRIGSCSFELWHFCACE